MPEYRALKDCFENGGRVRKGAVITADFGDNIPGHFELVTAGPKKPEPATKYTAEHRGRGQWRVVAPDGTEVEGGLEKQIALGQAAEMNLQNTK